MKKDYVLVARSTGIPINFFDQLEKDFGDVIYKIIEGITDVRAGVDTIRLDDEDLMLFKLKYGDLASAVSLGNYVAKRMFPLTRPYTAHA